MIQKNIEFYKTFLFIDWGKSEQPDKKKKEKKLECLQMNQKRTINSC